MKKLKLGALYRGWDGWLCRVLANTKQGARVRWETGHLAGKEALIYDPGLHRVG